MDQGLQILSEYGGSFFTDKQHEIGDEMTITEHYCRPRERWREYVSYLKELHVCAHKEYLHGVSLIKVSVSVCVRCVSCVSCVRVDVTTLSVVC